MSLNDLQLNAGLLAALYPKTLIGEAESKETGLKFSIPEPVPGVSQANPTKPIKTVAETQSGFKSLGNNQKNVLVVINYADITHLPDAQLDFLTNLLKACKLGLNDVAIINMNNYGDVNYSDILDNFRSITVMLFGLTTREFGFPFEIPEYQVQNFAGKTVIHSPALEDLEDNKVEKGKLWIGLKRIFNL